SCEGDPKNRRNFSEPRLISGARATLSSCRRSAFTVRSFLRCALRFGSGDAPNTATTADRRVVPHPRRSAHPSTPMRRAVRPGQTKGHAARAPRNSTASCVSRRNGPNAYIIARPILTAFRRNFADFSDRLQDSAPRKEQTVDRPSPYRTRALFAPTTLCVGLEPRANSTLMSGSSVNYRHWGGSEHKHKHGSITMDDLGSRSAVD